MRLFELLLQNVHTRGQYWKRGFINAFTDVLGLKNYRSSPPKVFLGKGVLKICSKFTYTVEHLCRSLISINLLIKITHRHCCSPVNLLHIFRKPFPKNTSCCLALFQDIFTSNFTSLSTITRRRFSSLPPYIQK